MIQVFHFINNILIHCHVTNYTDIDISDHLKLPPVKLHCSMLAEDAIKAAVRDYKKKAAPNMEQ